MGRVGIIDYLAASSLWHHLAVLNPTEASSHISRRGLFPPFFVTISLPKGWCLSPACSEAARIKTKHEVASFQQL